MSLVPPGELTGQRRTPPGLRLGQAEANSHERRLEMPQPAVASTAIKNRLARNPGVQGRRHDKHRTGILACSSLLKIKGVSSFAGISVGRL
jgi:hypothetical protein